MAFGTMTQLSAENYKLISPDGNLSMTISTDKQVKYNLAYIGKVLMKDNCIALDLGKETLGKNAEVNDVEERSASETVNAVNYRVDSFNVKYNEICISFTGDYKLILRMYDDGMAYRWITEKANEYKVKNEICEFNFTEDFKAYLPYTTARAGKDPYAMAFQNTYAVNKLSESDYTKPAFLPVTVDCENGVKVTFLESDLEGYPGMFVRTLKGKHSLRGEFAKYPTKMEYTSPRQMTKVMERADFIAKCEGKKYFPWRVVVVTSDDTQMPVNNLVYALASSNRIGNCNWIKMGKAAWEWWNDWGLYDVDFKAGINMETYKHYIDFAAENNLEFVVIDEGWYNPGSGDMLTVIPELDLPELIAYGKEKGVNLILWTVFNVLDEQLEAACKKYSAMGISGFKVDFLDRDDQTAVEMVYRIAEMTAKYNLTLDLHGVYKPTGINRTYPNVINFESVFGMEEMKWSSKEKDMMEYDVTMPFIRMMAGPVDYTPGAMRNATKKDFQPIYYNPMSQGTRCHQLAAYIVHDSPLTMLADNPTNYKREKECTDFIAEIPNNGFEETKILQGELGKYIVTARKHGSNWYVGGMTDWNARSIKLNLDFLGDGIYKAVVFTDGKNAYKQASDYASSIRMVNSGRTINIDMAPGGGFAMKLEPRPTFKGNVEDTLDFRLFVAVDKYSVEYLGGKEKYQKMLDKAFEKVNRKWNGYEKNSFNYYFRYIPYLKEIYEGSSASAEKRCGDKVDRKKYDLMLFMDGRWDNDDERGSFVCGQRKDGLTVISVKNGNKNGEVKNFMKDNWEGFAHELGHYRGVTDLYASQVRAEKNPVNGKSYISEKCFMLHATGNDIWSSYAVNIINKTAKSKDISRDFPNLFFSLFPEKMRVEVRKNGRPVKDATIRIYGTRAKYYDVITPAYRTYVTDDDGICEIDNIPTMYCNPPQPGRPEDLPWGRWFSFIMEAELDGKKIHEWLPEYKVQNVTFEGRDTYKVCFNF